MEGAIVILKGSASAIPVAYRFFPYGSKNKRRRPVLRDTESGYDDLRRRQRDLVAQLYLLQRIVNIPIDLIPFLGLRFLWRGGHLSRVEVVQTHLRQLRNRTPHERLLRDRIFHMAHVEGRPNHAGCRKEHNAGHNEQRANILSIVLAGAQCRTLSDRRSLRIIGARCCRSRIERRTTGNGCRRIASYPAHRCRTVSPGKPVGQPKWSACLRPRP